MTVFFGVRRRILGGDTGQCPGFLSLHSVLVLSALPATSNSALLPSVKMNLGPLGDFLCWLAAVQPCHRGLEGNAAERLLPAGHWPPSYSRAPAFGAVPSAPVPCSQGSPRHPRPPASLGCSLLKWLCSEQFSSHSRKHLISKFRWMIPK